MPEQPPLTGRVAVIGAGGQVGGALVRRLGALAVPITRRGEGGLDLRLVATSGSASVARLLERTDPSAVVLAAAMTDVEECERHPDAAFLVNAVAAATIARATRDHGARFIFVSSDYVYDGRDGPYDETAEPNPLSVYGRSKRRGEEYVLEGDPDATVVRTTVVYGPELAGRNFAYQLARRTATGARLRVAGDQVGTPTYNRDLAETLASLCTSPARGVLHVAGPELLARSCFARRLAEEAGLDPGLVEEVPTAALGQAAARPLRAGLISGRSGEVQVARSRGVAAAVSDWLARPAGSPWPHGVAPHTARTVERPEAGAGC